MVLYHGSENIIEQPIWGKGKFYNDYGRGFYCTEDIELAKEWACTDSYVGYVNMYQIDLDKLNVLDLTQGEYSVLNWLAILVQHRGIRVSMPIAKSSVNWLYNNYYIDVESYDAIVGYRADDSYFAFARAFFNNEISYKQLCYVINLGNLGEQVVIKSKYGFEKLRFIESKKSEKVYLQHRKNRDNLARKLFLEEMNIEELDGVYVRDIMRGGME